jgi:osmotically-inducible protein OsmY
MSNDDWRRNDQERYRDQDGDRRRSSQGQSYGRGTDYQGDGSIAQRGFGNARSGYDRGGDDRNRDYGGLGGGDDDRGGFGRGGREGMGDRFGGGGAYGSDNRGGGIAGGRGSRDFGGGSGGYGGDRSHRGEDRGQSGTFSGNDYSSGFYGADQGYRSDDDYGSRRYGGQERGSGRGDERGFLERAGDAVASWFSDDDSSNRQQDQRGGGWGGQSHRGRGPKGYARSDDRIQEDVSERLTHDHHVDASEIEVTVSNREVTLSGTVDSRDARRRAEDIAESVSGVTHVQNNLRVQQQAGSMGPIGAAASTTTGVSMEAGMPTGAASSNLGRTSGGGMSSSAVAGAMGTSGTTAQGTTGVEVSRSEGSAGRRKGGTAM